MEEFTPLQWTQERPDPKKYNGKFFAIYHKTRTEEIHVAQLDLGGHRWMSMPGSDAEFPYEAPLDAWWYGPLDFPPLPPEATE